MTLKILRSQHIELEDLQEQDLKHMDKEQLLTTSKLLLKQLSHINTPTAVQKTLKSAPTHSKRSVSVVGSKRGTTSKYHYVYFDGRNHKYRAKITTKDSTYYVPASTDEITVALSVDDLLDTLEDNKRPRNRNEFSEVNEAYYNRRKAGDADE